MTSYRLIQEALDYALEQGGATFHTGSLADLTEYERDAWAVGGSQGIEAEVIDLESDDSFIATLWAICYDDVLRKSAPFVGLWVDGGKLYIDAVDLISDTDEAVEQGYQRGEKAIYHINAQRTLELS